MHIFRKICLPTLLALALMTAGCSFDGFNETVAPSSAVTQSAEQDAGVNESPSHLPATPEETPLPSPQATDALDGLEVTFAGEELPVMSYNLEVYGFADAKDDPMEEGSVRLLAVEDFVPQFATTPKSWELVYLDREGHPVQPEEDGAAVTSFVITANYDEQRLSGEVRYSAAVEIVPSASLVPNSQEAPQGGVLVAEVADAVGYAEYSVYLPHLDHTVPVWKVNGRSFAILPTGMAGATGAQRAELMCAVDGGEAEKVSEVSFTVTETAYERQDLVTSGETQSLYTSDNLSSDNEKVRAARSVSNPEPYFTGTFDMPLEGTRTTEFGMQRYVEGSLQSRHSGYDIAAAAGTEIRAPEAGVVTFADELIVNGNTVVIDHGLSVFTSFSHMSEIVVENGDFVEKGAVIGYVGSTGYSTGPHLHYTVVISGYYVDPAVTQDAAVFSAISGKETAVLAE